MSATRSYSASVPAESGALAALRAFFGAVLRGAPSLATAEPDCVDRLVLALDEACANVIKHRKAAIDDGRIRVRVDIEPACVRFFVSGFCTAPDVDCIQPRSLDDVRPGGLGTAFIGKIMHRVEYRPDPDHEGALALVLEFSCPDGGGPGGSDS